MVIAAAVLADCAAPVAPTATTARNATTAAATVGGGSNLQPRRAMTGA
jgi:hypothetical protein